MTQKFHQKASVQVAIISTIGVIVVAVLTIFHQRSQLKADNERLHRETADKTAEIQRLETLLAPFRTIALQRYTASEPEALRMLAHRIAELEHATTPRTLSTEQVQQLLAALRAHPNGVVYVVSRMMDGEGSDYADQLTKVLANVWRVVRSPETRMLTENVTGLGVCSYKSTDKLPGHDVLRECLRAAGLSCEDVTIRANTVPVPDGPGLLLVVGRKN